MQIVITLDFPDLSHDADEVDALTGTLANVLSDVVDSPTFEHCEGLEILASSRPMFEDHATQ